MKANDTDTQGQASAETLRGVLLRLRWMAPVLIFGLAALLVLGFYVMALRQVFSFDAAHSLAAMVVLAALCTWVAMHWLLRWLRRTTEDVLNDVASSRQRVDANLRLRRNIASTASSLQRAQRPAELAQVLLSALAEHLKAYQSLCCLWDEKQSLLVAAARYGGDGASAEEVMTRRSHVGNLIGECARSGEPMVIHEPAADYMKVGSGLGEMAPSSIVLFPIRHGGRLFAVLELATVQPFDDEGLRLLQGIEPVFAMSLDILQRAQRSEELLEEARATQENTRLILSAVGDGILGVDAHGNTMFANPAALAMLGFEESEVLGQSAHGLIHHHHMDGTPYHLEDCPLTQTLFDGVTRKVLDEVLWRKDGTPLRVSYVSSAIHRGTEQAGAVLVFQECKT